MQRSCRIGWCAVFIGWLLATPHAAPAEMDHAAASGSAPQPIVSSAITAFDDPLANLARELVVELGRSADVGLEPQSNEPAAHPVSTLAKAEPVVEPQTPPASGSPAPAPVVVSAAPPAATHDAGSVPVTRVPLGAPRPATGDANTTTSPSAWADHSWVLKTAAALGVVIGLILLLRFGWSRLTGQAPAARSPVVEVLSRTTIAPRNHVLLLRLGDRILVVADSAAGLSTLANIDDPEEVASLLTAVTAGKPNSISRGFAHMLNRFNRDYTEDDRLTDEAADIDEYRTDRARDQLSSLLSQVRTIGTAGPREVSR